MSEIRLGPGISGVNIYMKRKVTLSCLSAPFNGPIALIYVVASNEPELLEKSKVELLKILNEDELGNSVLLVLANMMDSPDAMSPSEIAEKLALSSIGTRKWHIQATCAKTGEGLYEGLKWIDDTIQSPGQALLSGLLTGPCTIM